MIPTEKKAIIYTNKARCRDCYRCLRVCPVKAIRIRDGQAYVVPERCIGCGTCIRECPQKAKTFRHDVEMVKSLLREHANVVASVAPSYMALYPAGEREHLAAALKKLGFQRVEETAIGAELTARETAAYIRDHNQETVICSACPAVVQYLEQYQTDMLDHLAPVLSPMLAHAKWIKAYYGSDWKVVFIGPCLAKKMEAERDTVSGLIGAVLTFQELDEWIYEAGMDLKSLAPIPFDAIAPQASRLFPVAGGFARTAALETDMLSTHTIALTGYENIRDALLLDHTKQEALVFEPLFCREGCINGPGMSSGENLYKRKQRLLKEVSRLENAGTTPDLSGPMDLRTSYEAHAIMDDVPEAQIQDVLTKTGKENPDDQLNCGACGYLSCRDKAVAVLKGMAEVEMCLPYMRKLAEQRTDKIISTTPNGIVILDHQLNILAMNPAFRRMFQCSDASIGKAVSHLMDPASFEKLKTPGIKGVEGEIRFPNYNLVCHQLLYALEEEEQYVGIFVNITLQENSANKLAAMKRGVIMQSQDLLDHQIEMAQKMVRFLGESTAQSEALVKKMLEITQTEMVQREKEP